ncbi:sialidase enzyme penultimate C terminal domain protein [Acinetobacter sp. 1294596]|nr:sialidase enzyme penultimate C terminal domain protein [Acinetobacter sp. 1294596]
MNLFYYYQIYSQDQEIFSLTQIKNMSDYLTSQTAHIFSLDFFQHI